MELKMKKCIKCEEDKRVTEFYYHRNRKKYMNTCKKCNSHVCKNYQRDKRKEEDIKFLMQYRAGQVRRNCKNKNIKYDNNLKDILMNAWETQKGLCYYTGIEMSLKGDYHHNPKAMTIDRIIPELGYVKGNIALCTSMANRSKQNLNKEELKFLCEKFLESIENGKFNINNKDI